MKIKYLLYFILFVITINIFSEVLPKKIIEIKWKQKEDNKDGLGFLLIGEYLCPQTFFVDKIGNIFVDESLTNNRIQVYNKN